MTKPAVLQIADEIGLRLANMTIANGYSYDAGRIVRARIIPFRNSDLPAINYWPAFDELKDRQYRNETRTLDMRIEAYTTSRDDPFTDVAFELGNAVWTALNRAVAAPTVAADWSPNLGGLLRGFDLQQLTPVIGEGESPWCGCMLNLAATYKVDSYNHTVLS
jgi:hypothetical protein